MEDKTLVLCLVISVMNLPSLTVAQTTTTTTTPYQPAENTDYILCCIFPYRYNCNLYNIQTDFCQSLHKAAGALGNQNNCIIINSK
ncbi:hypothetical protein GDO81_018483 [Engystomops pustulosus]|uniref:Uncharacterized protein n=1 Tax=Engystomops pustulosus TaxID=76066 RepID=A0AAV6ZUW0_ENGPU|nr:hypothetical protein GDO81_018483 [Engystomops pustulosus]